jgi:hypothetical protein
MRENVTEELKQIQPEDESKRQMLDILKRFHLEDEMESDGEDGMFVAHVSVFIAVDSSVSLGLCTRTPFRSLLHFRCACHSF